MTVRGSVYVTVRAALPVKLFESVEVTVIMLLPVCKAIADADQLAVPVHTPLPPRLFDQATDVIEELPDARRPVFVRAECCPDRSQALGMRSQ